MKIDLGGGRIKKTGYTSIDVIQGDIMADITEGIPLDDAVVDSLYSHHLLEHIAEPQIDFVLSECFRVVKPGGEFDVTVPDFDDAYLRFKAYEVDGVNLEWPGMIFGTPSLGFAEFHKTVFTERKLRNQLKAVGFTVGEFDYPMWYGGNLHVIASKP